MLAEWHASALVYGEPVIYNAQLMFESGFGGYVILEAARSDGAWRAGVEMHVKVWLTKRFDTAEAAKLAAIGLAKRMLVECATELLQLEAETTITEVEPARLPAD